MLETVVLALLAVQGVLGSLDTLVNHELIERLPQRREARTEIALHALREANYAILFGGLAWFEWHGALAAIIAVLTLGEVAITAVDEFVENHVRVLPHNERVLHVLLTLNLGMIIATLVPTLATWASLSTELTPTYHGWLSWVLTALALAGITWSIRDLLAWRRLRWGAQYPAIRGAQ
ncbi:MAG TPA: hypothetical protein VJS66_00400 [Burkholderiales bacterium]|nr:hypothetical protein [Burkholderiales bacterium]